MADRKQQDETEGASPPEGARHAGSGTGAVIAYYTALTIDTIGFLAVAGWVLVHPPAAPAPAEHAVAQPRPDLAERRVRRALDVHRLVEQELPESLEPLHTRALLRRADVSYPDGTARWDFRRKNRSYELTRVDR